MNKYLATLGLILFSTCISAGIVTVPLPKSCPDGWKHVKSSTVFRVPRIENFTVGGIVIEAVLYCDENANEEMHYSVVLDWVKDPVLTFEWENGEPFSPTKIFYKVTTYINQGI